MTQNKQVEEKPAFSKKDLEEQKKLSTELRMKSYVEMKQTIKQQQEVIEKLESQLEYATATPAGKMAIKLEKALEKHKEK